jgi:hypothetical protein
MANRLNLDAVSEGMRPMDAKFAVMLASAYPKVKVVGFVNAVESEPPPVLVNVQPVNVKLFEGYAVTVAVVPNIPELAVAVAVPPGDGLTVRFNGAVPA